MNAIGFAHLRSFFDPAAQPGMPWSICGCVNFYCGRGHVEYLPWNEARTACGDARFNFLLLADIIPANASGGSARVTRACDAGHAEGGAKRQPVVKKLVELVGLEPTASSLRTTASTKLNSLLAYTSQPSSVHYGPIQTTGSPGVASNFTAREKAKPLSQ